MTFSRETVRTRFAADFSGFVCGQSRSSNSPHTEPSPPTAAPMRAGSPACPSALSHASNGAYSLAMCTVATTSMVSRRAKRASMTSSSSR